MDFVIPNHTVKQLFYDFRLGCIHVAHKLAAPAADLVNINVIDLINKSRDDVAYNLIDLEERPDQGLLDAICAIDAVINVRVITADS